MKLCETCKNKECNKRIVITEQENLKITKCLEYVKDNTKINKYKKQLNRTATQLKPLMSLNIQEVIMKRWTRESAERYITRIDKAKGIRGLSYWSAVDYLRNHRTMHSIV